MTEANKETIPSPGSPVPGRRSEGSAGSSREVTRPDAKVSGTAGTGQENTKNEPAQEEPKTGNPAPNYAERKTELRGLGIAPSKGKKSTLRRHTEQDLNGPDPEVPYARFETAVRGLVCSLMERQDRMNEEIFFKLNDLGYRQDDLEETVDDLKSKERSG
jgi:hypothetical protein